MAFDNSQANVKLASLNKRLGQKFLACWAIAGLVYVFCLGYGDAASSISGWTALHIPSIAKLNNLNTAIDGLAGKFFGVGALFLPVFTLIYLWRGNWRQRFLHFQPQTGRGVTETIFVVYALGLPFIAFVLWVFYEAPIEMPDIPRLSGQHVLHLMIYDRLGLFFFGTLLIALLPAGVAIAFAYLWLPFSALFHYFSKGSSK